MDDPLYICPSCKSERVATYSEQAFMVNTGEYFCESVRPTDDDAKASCHDCHWTGVRSELQTKGVPNE